MEGNKRNRQIKLPSEGTIESFLVAKVTLRWPFSLLLRISFLRTPMHKCNDTRMQMIPMARQAAVSCELRAASCAAVDSFFPSFSSCVEFCSLSRVSPGRKE